ncbi:arsenate reductase (glutaredoxin) [Rufibacter glacialis]|uniref:Arsenate reductase (Glutaredoxin) n=1 Tax=Rufibacter glacialis TaxID=1259555 RepID=A0A5M8Q6S3_9BACT|nr:arsenate reductase (glutaredoxin) [Rufibacter glacialis]KAA6430761.1 arsenate reductase (glutaredoxin) [Rufibacter glacialis]GGK86517.1 arsenate reductase (glutaredoxin) [Rufibacter glacialis]
MITIYHNNRCSKSRQALELIQNSGQEVNVIHYLSDTPTIEELKGLLHKLKLGPEDLLRKSEKLYKEVYVGQHLTSEEWLQVLVQHPVLLERPIVVNGDKAVIGRPPENVLTIL